MSYSIVLTAIIYRIITNSLADSFTGKRVLFTHTDNDATTVPTDTGPICPLYVGALHDVLMKKQCLSIIF